MADYEGSVWDKGGAVFNVLASYGGQPGADPSGTADSAAAIQRTLNAGSGGVVVLPKGTYLADGLTIGDDTTVIGYSAIIKGRAGTSAPLLTVGNRCRLVGITLDGDKNNRPVSNEGHGIGIVVAQVDDTEVLNCTIRNCARTGIRVNNSNRFLIGGCNITACGMFGIVVVYSHHGRIAENYVSNCVNNIQWWGGDAAQTNTIGVTHLTITGNVSLDGEAGIWGSLGAYITIAGNTVRGMSDVGIDFEGCQHCTASGNAVTNCVNGGITVYYGSAYIAITGNTIHQEESYGGGFYIHSPGFSRYITFAGNVVRCAQAGAVWSDQAAAEHVLIHSNELICEGDGIIVRLLEINKATLSGNQARGVGGVGFSIEGGSDSCVVDNRIETTADGSTGHDVGGIHLYWRSTGFPCQRNTIRSNVVVGYRYAINDNCWGNQTSHNWIYENRVSSGIYRRAGANYAGRIDGNVSQVNPNQAVTPTIY
jgi:parallel beta-helix repeat protein